MGGRGYFLLFFFKLYFTVANFPEFC